MTFESIALKTNIRALAFREPFLLAGNNHHLNWILLTIV